MIRTPPLGAEPPEGPSSRDPARETVARSPWWLPRVLGRPRAVAPEHVHLLGVISLALLFENYDQAMLTAALKQIAETFGLIESDLSQLLGLVHGGAILAFLIIPFADRIGRRRLFLISLIGLSVATVLAGFAQSVGQFIFLQMVSRTFMITCTATAFVIITEEFPASDRGWGIGIAGALGSVGHGLGLLLFAAIDVLPFGWRALYVVGMAPLLMLPMFRREVRETRRFERQREDREAQGESPALFEGWWRPLASLTRAYPWRTLAVGAIGATAAAGHTVGFSFSAYFVQTQHGWAPWQFTVMAMIAGAVGIIGHPYAGRLADRSGRRRVGFALLGSYPLVAYAFYSAPGWALPFAWVALIFSLTGGITIMRALATELFPTSHRGTSSGWLHLSEAGGRVAGLFLVGWGTAAGESNVPMIRLVVFMTLIAAVLVAFLPETGRRELEEISAEP